MRPVSGRGRDQRREVKKTTILLLRLQYEKEKIRCEIKPVAVRYDDQRVGAVVLVVNERTSSPLRQRRRRLNECTYYLGQFGERDGLDQIFRYTCLKRFSFPFSKCHGGKYHNGDGRRSRILFEYYSRFHRVHIWKV